MNQQRKKTEIKNMILRESYKLFMEEGYTGITTRQIASVCELSRSLLHYYYNKKEFILLEILQLIDKMLAQYFAEFYPASVLNSSYQSSYVQIFFGLKSRKENLTSLPWELFKDTSLMQQFILRLPYFEKSKETNSFRNYDMNDISVFVFYGTISQLANLKMNGFLTMNTKEMLESGMTAFYAYRGMSQQKIEEVIRQGDQYDWEKEIMHFTEYYETNLGWK